MDATTHLANGESSLMNIACESKAEREPNHQTFIYPQVAHPMMKATLLEPNHLETSINRYCHCWDGAISMLLTLSQRESKAVNTTQVTRSDHNDESLASKGCIRTECVTGGLPKSQKTHGNGVSIVPALMILSLFYGGGNSPRKGSDTANNQSKLRYYSTGSATQTSNVVDKLDNLRLRAKESPVIDRNLISLLSNPTLLEIAYNNIKSKPGNMTPGITPETLVGMSGDWFTETAELLRSGKFDFKPGCSRINIPKASCGTRPLSIGTPRDKIVQEAMRMILEAIYEPNFSDNSHGFRPFRSCHSALKAFYTKFQYSQWLIEGDIYKCFDSIEHNKLMNLIERKISDRRFTHYINKALKAGYFEFITYKHNIAVFGTPQGSIISPLLANIFLHQLDEFIASLKEIFDKGEKPQINPIARYYEGKIARAKAKGNMKLVHDLSMEARRHSFMNFEDPNLRRLMYLRYADDWIIGVRGTLKETQEILKIVSDFCTSIGLTVSQQKTKITNLSTSKALFLGVELSRSNTIKFARVKSSSSTKRLGLRLRMTAPIARIIKKLTETGFIVKNEPAPRFRWLHNNHDQIIHLYNSVMRGFLNYYSFAHNYSRLVSLLNHILKQSAAKLLAAKFKLGTRAKVFAKFGPNLTSLNKVSFMRRKPSYKGNYLDFMVSKVNPHKIENLQGLYVTGQSKSGSIASLYNQICQSCGSSHRVEMHHVRKMSDLNPKINTIDRLMVRAHRKQIPLCRKCHMNKHHNTKKKS
jgi:group II intron reverse transcriptase/maturase